MSAFRGEPDGDQRPSERPLTIKITARVILPKPRLFLDAHQDFKANFTLRVANRDAPLSGGPSDVPLGGHRLDAGF